MKTIIKIPTITFAETVLEQIKRTVGTHQAETGGLLGGIPETGAITHYYFDEHAERTAVTYTVAPDRINPIIARWNREDIHLMGIIHSHPQSFELPSTPDIEFVRRILDRKDNIAMKQFLSPIVQSQGDGKFSMRLFSVSRDVHEAIFELPFGVAPLLELLPFPVPSDSYRKSFDRVRTAYDLPRLHNSMVIAIGCGGAAAFLEDVARTGVRFFVLMDPDVVSESNLTTQQCYRKDLGRAKVDVIKQRILDINPWAIVTTVQKPIEAFSDSDFRTLVFEEAAAGYDIEARLLCGFTDNFWAQMRVNLLALQFTLPTLSAQVYKGGAAAEIVFTHPDTTAQCMRCVLSQRYRAYMNEGFQNDAESQGAQYYATIRLNATKFFVAMASLHHGSVHGFWGPLLGRIGQRNCIQIRCDPDVGSKLGLKNFEKAFSNASSDRIFCDESIFLPQHPENHANGYSYDCPDCGGGGNLLACQGRFPDTRIIVNSAMGTNAGTTA